MTMLYAATIFLSAFLLFQVQPLMGKLILPWFGGTAAVWSSCLLFFQLVLLLGYCYAHWGIRRLPPRRQAMLHAGLLVLSLGLLPLALSTQWQPAAGDNPALGILLLMTATVGLPYFLLSATGPMLQAWLARERPGSRPYRLFALSNAGSLLGLLSFPLLLEPRLPTPVISQAWSAGYLLFVVGCAALAMRQRQAPRADAGPAAAIKRAQKLLWLILACLPTILLMAVTSHLTANIAPVPLLWVLPLLIYLLTFILCFESARWYRRQLFLPLLIVLAPAMIVFYGHPNLLPQWLGWPMALFNGGLFVGCMVCHGELARSKPPSSGLTGYYLILAAGGALGGLFVALLAPLLFREDFELAIACVGMLCVAPLAIWRTPASRRAALGTLQTWHKVSGLSLGVLILVWLVELLIPTSGALKARNFYGSVKVYSEAQGSHTMRILTHGTTVHGLQFTDQGMARLPTSYFGQGSGVGAGIAASSDQGALRVGVVGLGAGTIAAYCRPGDQYRFYEINPLIGELAARQFSFLSGCATPPQIVLGDARLSLAAESPQRFDVLVLDAFSGDAIPVHLLTREAFGLYLRHLRPGGLLAVHISNRYLDLAPVVKSAADFFGQEAYFIDARSDHKRGLLRSQWVVLGTGERIARLHRVGHKLDSKAPALSWTDDYSSVFGVLK